MQTIFKIFTLLLILSLNFTANGKEVSYEEMKKCPLDYTKKIIIDAIPGEEMKAEKILINCVRTNAKETKPLLQLAKLIEKQVISGERSVFEIKKSLALISQAYGLEPSNPDVRYTLSHILGTLGEYEQAQSMFNATFDEFPSSKETLIEKAKLIATKDPDEALKLLESSVNIGAEIDDVFDIILLCAKTKSPGNSDSKVLITLANKFPNRWIWHKLGLAYLEEQNYQNASIAFKKSIELGNNIESRLQLAIIEYQYLNDEKNSLIHFQELLHEMNQESYILDWAQAIVYSHYSLASFSNKNINAAEQLALTAVQKNLDKKDFLQTLASEYKARKALYILKPTLEYITKNDPAYDLAYALLGEIYKGSKEYEKSIEMLEKAISLNPNNDNYYALKSTLYYNKKDFEKSLANIDKALEINPGFTTYLYNKSCILAILGKNAESFKLLKTVLENDKAYYSVAKNDPDFNSFKLDVSVSREFASLFYENHDGKWITTDAVTRK